MKKPECALLLIGSPRKEKSTSGSLGEYLLKGLGGRIPESRKLYLYKSLSSEEGKKELLDFADNSDLLILSFPLYVDGIPSAVIETLEMIARHEWLSEKRLVAISNCGFPESSQNDTALAICRRFAARTGMEWAGGLALGGGEALHGRPLETAGGIARNIRKALDLAADALADGKPVPEEAMNLMGKKLIPIWLYLFFGNYGWKKQAKENKVGNKIYDQPYLKVEDMVEVEN